MRPYYIARAIGGLLFLIGAVVGFYNILMTIRAKPREVKELEGDFPAGMPSAAALQPGE